MHSVCFSDLQKPTWTSKPTPQHTALCQLRPVLSCRTDSSTLQLISHLFLAVNTVRADMGIQNMDKLFLTVQKDCIRSFTKAPLSTPLSYTPIKKKNSNGFVIELPENLQNHRNKEHCCSAM